jgi:superfamily II DNA helicase RecQ
MEFLRHQFPNVQWYFTSATLSQEQITYLKAKFRLEKEKTRIIRLSNDRPNVQLIAKEMTFPASSFEDLLVFLGPKPSVRPNGPVIVYFNSKKDCQEAATFFRATLKAIDPALETKANWFHSNNSQEYAESVIQKLNAGDVWYLFATEILGMVSIY